MKKALNLLGLSARARKIVSGEKACVQAIRKGAVFTALIDAGAAENAQKALADACRTHGVPLVRVPEGALGAAIGRENRKVVGVTDRGLAQRIRELADRDE